MADFLQLVSMLREQMNATLSRSDALRPLAWLVGILATTTVLLVFAHAPVWLVSWAGSTLVGSIALYAAAYVFCLFLDRDALRSERYSLHKLAIEHGLYGDNRTGLLQPEEPSQEAKAIEAQPVTDFEGRQ